MELLAQCLQATAAPFGWLVGGGEGSTYLLARWIFLRLLGGIYLVAFASLWSQLAGLLGERGILPAREVLEEARRLGPARYRLVPSLFWLRADDRALGAACAGGVLLSLLLLAGFLPALAAAGLWALYLSLAAVARDFLAFQWDVLLLEAGFLAILLAPWSLGPGLASGTGVSPLALALLWWLLFRLVFESGVVKLTSGDPTWRDLTALRYHYFTQPLPTPLAWLLHQAPPWFHRLSCLAMYAVEIGGPLLIFAPRELRLAGAATMVLFQVLILASGNYNFFNLLTIALCLLLVDDAAWRELLPAAFLPDLPGGAGGPVHPAALGAGLAVAAVVLPVSLVQLHRSLRPGAPGPRLLGRLEAWLVPFRSLNAYGLFRVMTRRRPEIVLEGSADGENWRPYAFRYKPGEVTRRPPVVQPHQPRLDWQMWFAALRSYPATPWFQRFALRLLEGSPPVLGLLAEDPFPGDPPRYLRALLYDYRFTDPRERRRTGAWWRRELLGPYSPVLSLGGP